MDNAISINVVRVFVDGDQKYGNPVGIVVDEKQKINPPKRQTISTKVGFSETVFINDVAAGNVSIYNPEKEVKFAGHALVGTAYFINKIIGKATNLLQCKGGLIRISLKDDQVWIYASLEETPPWNYEQLSSVSSVENFPALAAKETEHTMIWAWLDKSKRILRARTFAPDWGIPEDEANGSGSMQLATAIGKPIEIHHGRGSIIYAKPDKDGFASVGGMVVRDESREILI